VHLLSNILVLIDQRNVTDLAELQSFADALVTKLKGGETIGLSGTLGAGKTTFTRLFAAALGSANQVTSPSFALCNEYECRSGITIEHWDLYRLSVAPPQLLESPPAETIRLIEWVERLIGDELKTAGRSDIDFLIKFELGTDGHRRVRLSKVEPQ